MSYLRNLRKFTQKIIREIREFLNKIFSKPQRRPKSKIRQKNRLKRYGDIEIDIFKRVNRERERRKLLPLTWDPSSYNIAKRRATEIIHNFNHEHCPKNYGENIAQCSLGRVLGLGNVHYKSLGRSFLTIWMRSPGHRENILNKKYTKISIGIEKKGRQFFAVQLFQ